MVCHVYLEKATNLINYVKFTIVKKMPAFFTALSVFGILVGLFLVSQGMWGDGIGKLLTLAVGIFVTIKEILDIVFSN